MGRWAETAVVRFFSEADKERRSEELELVRHHKLQAGAEKTWKALCAFVESEANDFNRRIGREFFDEVTTSNITLRVQAPKGVALCVLDERVPEINIQHDIPPVGKPKTSEFPLALKEGKDGEYILITGKAAGIGLSVESLGARVLDPLVA